MHIHWHRYLHAIRTDGDYTLWLVRCRCGREEERWEGPDEGGY